jgi:hypothetical protein
MVELIYCYTTLTPKHTELQLLQREMKQICFGIIDTQNTTVCSCTLDLGLEQLVFVVVVVVVWLPAGMTSRRELGNKAPLVIYWTLVLKGSRIFGFK